MQEFQRMHSLIQAGTKVKKLHFLAKSFSYADALKFSKQKKEGCNNIFTN